MAYKNYKDLFTEIKTRSLRHSCKPLWLPMRKCFCFTGKWGHYILQNQEAEGWGTKIIDRLSADIKKAFPTLKGFSPRNHLYMKHFAEAYPVWLLHQFIDIETEI